jgi:hypothetical protein
MSYGFDQLDLFRRAASYVMSGISACETDLTA